MKPRSVLAWDRHRRTVVLLAESLACAYGAGSLPIMLREIAKARRVKEVVFAPLLKDGFLVAGTDGFSIHVNCPKEKVEAWTETWNDQRDGGRGLPERCRFTLAHEIAHTFFFDIGKRTIRPLVNVRTLYARKATERACNLAAGHLLVPEAILCAQRKEGLIAPLDFFDARDIAVLRRRARISAEALLIRLANATIWEGDPGAIFYLQEQDGSLVAQDFIIHGSLRNLFPPAPRGTPAADLLLCPELICYGGKRSVTVNSLPRAPRSRPTPRPFVVTCVRVYDRGRTYFVAMRPGERPD